MILFPAIDILDGRVVRLSQGDYDKATIYASDPLAQACEFAAQGASWVHVVDLDGAREGVPRNIRVIERIARESGLHVEVGGGIRTLETLEQLACAGVERMVLGTVLIKDRDFAQQAGERYGDGIVAGIDARNGEVAIEGWREGAGVDACELACEMRALGIKYVIYTDIARDGMRTGIDVDAYARLARETGMEVTASGGISTLDDVRVLQASGEVYGAIVGRALYEGSFALPEALALCK